MHHLVREQLHTDRTEITRHISELEGTSTTIVKTAIADIMQNYTGI